MIETLEDIILEESRYFTGQYNWSKAVRKLVKKLIKDLELDLLDPILHQAILNIINKRFGVDDE